MEEELGAELVAALDAIAENWRELVWQERREDVLWSIGWDPGADPRIAAAILHSPVVARNHELGLIGPEVDHLAGATMPLLQALHVGSSRMDEDFASTRFALGPVLAAAPALTTLVVHAGTVELASSEHLQSLDVQADTVIWVGARFPALESLVVGLDPAPEAETFAWLLEGQLAPNLCHLHLAEAGFVECLTRVREELAIASLRELEISARISEAAARAAFDDLGALARLGRLHIDHTSAQAWFGALERAVRPLAGQPMAAILEGMVRGRELFFGLPHPALQRWTFQQVGKRAEQTTIIQVPHGRPGTPETLEQAVCALSGVWERCVMMQRGIPGSLRPGAWEIFVDRFPRLFIPLEPVTFDLELDTALDRMRHLLELRVSDHQDRLLSRSFVPPVGPANRAYGARNGSTDAYMVAETDDAYVLLVWIS